MHYALDGLDKRIFVAEYRTKLPTQRRGNTEEVGTGFIKHNPRRDKGKKEGLGIGKMRIFLLIVFILLLLWVLCGVISYFIIRHICISIDGIKPSSFRGATAFIVAGPLGLLIMIAALIFMKKKMIQTK